MTGTLYEWLGIDPAAPVEAIIDALRCKVLELTALRKRLRLHPDPHTEKLIKLGFHKIAEARDNLLNPNMRLAYDRSVVARSFTSPSSSKFPEPPARSTSAILKSADNLHPGSSGKQPERVRLPDELVDLTKFPLSEPDPLLKPDLEQHKEEVTHLPEGLSRSEAPLPLELLNLLGTRTPTSSTPQDEIDEPPDRIETHPPSENETPEVPINSEATPSYFNEKDLPYWLVDQGIPPSQRSNPNEEAIISYSPQPEQEEPPAWLAGFEPSPPKGEIQESEVTSPDFAGSQAAPVEAPDWLAGLPIPESRQTKPLPTEAPVSQPEPDHFPSTPPEAQENQEFPSEPAIFSAEDIATPPVQAPKTDDQPTAIKQEPSDFTGWLESLPPMAIDESPDWLDDLEDYLTSAEPIPIEQDSSPEPPWFSVVPQPNPARTLGNPPLTGPNLPPTASLERFPENPSHSKTEVREVTRYGRVDYYTPMDKGREYPLRVGLLLEQQDKNTLKDARILWATLSMAASEAEPTIHIIPTSKFLRISPVEQVVKVKQGEEAFADFRVLPLQVPRSLDNKCNLRIEFIFRDKVIQTVSLDVKVQWKVRLGPLQISHMQWKWFGLIGLFDAVAGLFGFFTPTGSLTNLLILSGSLLFGLSLLIISLLLWQKAAKHLYLIF